MTSFVLSKETILVDLHNQKYVKSHENQAKLEVLAMYYSF